jgi:hypothetical protein
MVQAGIDTGTLTLRCDSSCFFWPHASSFVIAPDPLPAVYCTGNVACPEVCPFTVMVTGTALPGVTPCGTVTLIW